jgi:hypothetical protein
MNDDEALARAAQNVEATGKARYTEKHWNQAIGAIGRALPPNVAAADVVREALRQPDPAAALYNAGKEVLAARASEFDHEAEAAYSAMRRDEREAHYASKGRVR